MDSPSIHDAVAILINKADQLNQSGQPRLAVEMLSKGIEHAPQDQTLHYALAEILIQNEHYQDALSALAIIVLALVIYVGFKAYRRREGIDINKIYEEIPVE